MAKTPKVLVAGESWTVHSIHQKGFDSFTTTEYAEGVGWLREALASGGWDFHHMPAHVAARDFPATAEALAAYDCVILSDVGANTLLIHPDTFLRFKSLPNRLAAIRDYVASGGGLIMVGGYMTFQGIEGKARYHGTPVEEALPVTISTSDDRAETPEGVSPEVLIVQHPIVAGLPSRWPVFSATITSSPRSPRRQWRASAPTRWSWRAPSARDAASPSLPIAGHTGRRQLSWSGMATRHSGVRWPPGPRGDHDRSAGMSCDGATRRRPRSRSPCTASPPMEARSRDPAAPSQSAAGWSRAGHARARRKLPRRRRLLDRNAARRSCRGRPDRFPTY